ncbi:MAG: hypothetical protein DLM61_03190 [Pseudonocardiales bacterium]|nr:MAG: hypothetical protein DLM61_03190 [Pseudonocardiales bacterium]
MSARALVPITTTLAVPDAQTDVVGTVHLVEGELVVRIRPTQHRDVTTQPVHRHYPGCECRIAGTVRYVGPMTPADRAQCNADVVAWWDARPWWRRWSTDLADRCWARWRS